MISAFNEIFQDQDGESEVDNLKTSWVESKNHLAQASLADAVRFETSSSIHTLFALQGGGGDRSFIIQPELSGPYSALYEDTTGTAASQ